MQFWFDADNGPHVLVMKPLAEKLTMQGHEVRFTARDRASTCQLLDLYGFQYQKIGGAYGNSGAGKILGTLKRTLLLKNAMKSWKADVSFGHGSRSLPIASRLLNVPSITMYDYEWVNPLIFNKFCDKILLPDAISPERCLEAGIDMKKVRFYRGYKENLYLDGFLPDPSIARELSLEPGKIRVLLRPPAITAHYHNPEADLILESLLDRLLGDENIQLVWIPRSKENSRLLQGNHKADVVIPGRVFPGPQLINEMDMVIGGGGTMTREAAILGVPAVSFFRGRSGAVDESLAKLNRLTFIERASEATHLSLKKKDPSIGVLDTAGTVSAVLGFLTEG